VRQSKFFTLNIGRCLIALAILATIATIFFSSYHFSLTRVVEAQARRQQKRSRPKPKSEAQTQLKIASSITGFRHESHRAPTAKLICADCHTIPSRQAPDEISAATKSTIKGYPYHDSCLECHRRTPPQFFSGAAPDICSVCHTRSSPRLTAREVSPFPKHSEELVELEFPGYFPHDQTDHKRINCATCHMTDGRAYAAIPVGGGENAYKPVEGTFRTSPSGHDVCFKCHWQDEKPRKDDCAGCHLTPEAVAKKPRNQLSANAMEWFQNWPREWPKRLSLKFNHESKDHDEECTTCHDLTKIETLNIVKAEVPIATCAKSNCHFSATSRPSINKEMFEEDDDIAEGRNNSPLSKLGQHTCTGCHTNVIGGTPPPCSHYLLFGEQYLMIEDYPKSAKQIIEQCKK
jgi:hypothetical protein